jgi:2-oxoglutarate dehydrogenase E2 component (dihydrolipoamide succinyltransferase)
VTKSDVLAWLLRQASAPAPEGAPAAAAVSGAIAGTVPPISVPAEEGTLRLPKFSVPRYEPQPGDQVIPFSRIRKRIADHMVASNVISPRVTTVAEVNMARIAKLREAHREPLRAEGVSLTFLPFVIAAMGRAIADYPGINASVQDDALIVKKAVHVGVAVDTERGLLVPVIRDANRRGVLDLARALQDLGDRGRSRTLAPDDMAGGTIAVTNPGAKGNLFGTPVINQPHVVIVRMGEVVKRPVVVTVDGEDLIAIRPMMYLALTYDHRVVDGVTGNGALHRVREILEAGDFDL